MHWLAKRVSLVSSASASSMDSVLGRSFCVQMATVVYFGRNVTKQTITKHSNLYSATGGDGEKIIEKANKLFSRRLWREKLHFKVFTLCGLCVSLQLHAALRQPPHPTCDVTHNARRLMRYSSIKVTFPFICLLTLSLSYLSDYCRIWPNNMAHPWFRQLTRLLALRDRATPLQTAD